MASSRLPYVCIDIFASTTSFHCECHVRSILKSAALLQLDARSSDHLGPFVGVFDNVFAEFVWRICRYCIAKFGDPLFHRGSSEAGLSFSIISLGVFRGTARPAKVLTSKPGTNSATVGTSGSNGARVLAVTASARNLPALTYSMAEGKVGQTACPCPPSRSVSASDSPR